MLKLMDLTADEATNGLEAIQKVEKAYIHRKCCLNYSLILMDCNMPIMDGYQATTKIKQMVTDKQINHCLIVAVTAYNSEHNTVLCTQAGMDYIIPKPVSMSALKKAFQFLDIFV